MKKPNNKKIYWMITILAVFLLITTSYYLINLNKLDRRSEIIGDALCGNLADKDGQDYCCTQAHKDDATILCVGGWKYLQGEKYCQYICDGALPTCTEESKTCENGRIVTRNASNECNFNDC